MIILKKIKKQWKLYPIGSPKGALNNKENLSMLELLNLKNMMIQ